MFDKFMCKKMCGAETIFETHTRTHQNYFEENEEEALYHLFKLISYSVLSYKLFGDNL